MPAGEWDDRIYDLVARWQEKREEGEAVSAESLCCDCPELASELARRIQALIAMDRLVNAGSGAPDFSPDGTDAITSATMPQVRYTDLRLHAEGGLGQVFTAQGEDLSRRVALKFIRPRRAGDAESRRRFLFEAQVTGRLEHPGVVPVYGLGAGDGGLPCYAMRLIRGETLQEALEAFHAADRPARDPAERSRALRGLLLRFISVCNTVAYAHSRSVLHRDLKPKNVMLGAFGETLVVDWGLAKAMAAPATESAGYDLPPVADSEAVPLTVGPMGSPGYMSPEQACNEAVGTASDIYSLGAMLYAILTARPPITGSTAEVIERTRRNEFPPARAVNPAVHPALEAVCAKAMATRPDARYSDALALAADIDRWLADAPISAWRDPVWDSVRRWARRNRTAVTAAGAALVAGLIGLAALAVAQSRHTIALSNANVELEGSKAAVQARYDLAVEAIKTFHTGVSEDFLLKGERFKELRNRLLTSASDYYVKLGSLLVRETDAASRRALASSNFELAKLTDKVGRKEDALAAHRAVLAAREAMAAKPGADIATRVDVGRSLTEVALLLNSTGKNDESLAAYRRSESLLAGLAGSDPAAREALAACRTRMAGLLAYAGETAAALASYQLARSDQEALAEDRGASADVRCDLAQTVNQIALLLWYTGRLPEAEAEYRSALAIQHGLADDNPTVALYRSVLATSHFGLAFTLELTGSLSEAEAEYRAALAIRHKLADDNPTVTLFGKDLAMTRYGLGLLLSAVGKPAEAEIELETAKASMRKMADENPGDVDLRIVLAMSRTQLGSLQLRMGQPGEAEAECLTAVEIERKLVAEHPDVIFYRDRLVDSLTCLGEVVRARGRAAAARDLYRQAIALGQPRVEQDPADTQQRYYLVCAMRRRGLTLGDLGDPAGAAADARRALGMCNGLPPRSVTDLFETACCHAALAGLAGRAGSGVSAAEGEAEAARAIDFLGRAVVLGYRNRNELRIESALDPLRSRDDFRLMMMDVDFPAEPFARVDDRPGS